MTKLPYRIQWFQGPGDNRSAFKIYPNKDGSDGLQVRAVEEEVAFAARVEELETEAATLRARVAELEAQPAKAKR